MPSPIDSTWPTSATSASLPKLAICCFRIAEISAARISIKAPSASALHGKLQPLQLASDGPVDHAGAHFDDHTADQPRVDLDIDRDPAADTTAKLLVQCRELGFRQGLRCSHLGVDLAAPRRKLRQECLDHRRDGEETAVAGHDGKEITNQRR